MRKFLILIAFLIPNCCFAQFFDDFSSSIVFKNNGWQGNSTHFVLSGNSLRLNNPTPPSSGTTSSYLLAPFNTTGEESTWDIGVRMNFNPSANNHALFFLCSDQKDATKKLSGYFVRLGGKYDEIELCRQEGEIITPLITVSKRLTAQNVNEIELSIALKKGRWTLLSRFNSETIFRNEGSVNETSSLPVKSGYTGWMCNYTKSNANRFYLNHIHINQADSPNPPIEPEDPEIQGDTIFIKESSTVPETSDTLYCESVKIADTNNVLMYMNTPVNLSKAYILVTPSTHKAVIRPTQYPHIIHVTLTPSLIKGDTYCLIWGGIYDLNGKIMNGGAFAFKNGTLPENPTEPEEPTIKDVTPQDFGEIMITEIMANPKGITSLPEVEYVELYNPTNRTLSLDKCKFYYGSKPYILNEYRLQPGEYVILCNSTKLGLFGNNIPALGISTFPTLANTGKLLYIENPIGELLHWVDYSDKWYATTAQKAGGFSLEMMYTKQRFASADNWTGCISKTGGTPGKQNSAKSENTNTKRPYLSRYQFDESGNLLLSFSKSMDEKGIKKIVRETYGEASSGSFPDYPKNMIFTIEFTDISHSEKELSINNLICIDNLTIYPHENIKYATTKEADRGDIIFNEILVRPTTDAAPFIELRNLSENYLDLSEIALNLLDADSTVQSIHPLSTEKAYCNPGAYILISEQPEAVFNRYEYQGKPQIIRIATFPKITSNHDILALSGITENKLEAFRYQTNLHTKENIDLTGISLERRNPFRDVNLRSNWTSGSSETGFATPGYENHADTTLTDAGINERKGKGYFSMLHQALRLESGHPDSELSLLYDFSDHEIRLTATLFTSGGIKVCRLATNQLISGTGEINWKEQWRTTISDTPGIYILILEYISDSGLNGNEKLAIPLIP